ncbi:MAG: helix-turn-helix transcriptional regulator [Gemmatimonadota bacterium]
MLISSARVGLSHVPALARLVRDFASVPVLGLAADEAGPETLTGTLLLGRAGVLAVYDADSSIGLTALRSALARNLPAAFQRQCVSSILTAIAADGRGDECDAGCTRGVARFFAEVFAPNVSSARCVAALLGVHPATLASRFQRAGLPSVKQYIAEARLVLAARLGETSGLSISAIAHRLDASSPQSFSRTVRTLTGLSAVEFRRAFTGAAMLDRYRTTLVTPFREILRGFDPLGIESRRTGASEPAPAIVGRAA